MAEQLSDQESAEIFAEELVKCALKSFGIYWNPSVDECERKLVSLDLNASSSCFCDAVRLSWKKFNHLVSQESRLTWDASSDVANAEQLYSSLDSLGKKIPESRDAFFILMAIFADVCVRMNKSGKDHLIAEAVSAIKRIMHDKSMNNSATVSSKSNTFIQQFPHPL